MSGAAKACVVVEVSGLTDTGRVRENNEDRFLVADLTAGDRDELAMGSRVVGERGLLLGVCDGVGGAPAGEVASQLAVDAVYETMQAADPPRDPGELGRRLANALESAGLQIWREGRLERETRGMGTTATVAAFLDDRAVVGQVGDSRAYVLREGELSRLTRDQSLEEELLESGELSAEELEGFGQGHVLLQALGTTDWVHVELTPVTLREGDTLLLCSDGLPRMLGDGEIREVLRSVDDPREACRVLTERANEEGGRDNVTVVVAKVRRVPPSSG